jgi:hypothetical protein
VNFNFQIRIQVVRSLCPVRHNKYSAHKIGKSSHSFRFRISQEAFTTQVSAFASHSISLVNHGISLDMFLSRARREMPLVSGQAINFWAQNELFLAPRTPACTCNKTRDKSQPANFTTNLDLPSQTQKNERIPRWTWRRWWSRWRRVRRTRYLFRHLWVLAVAQSFVTDAFRAGGRGGFTANAGPPDTVQGALLQPSIGPALRLTEV